MHNPIDRIVHTTAFVTSVVDHWLEQEITQWVHHEGASSHTIAKWLYLSWPKTFWKLSVQCTQGHNEKLDKEEPTRTLQFFDEDLLPLLQSWKHDGIFCSPQACALEPSILDRFLIAKDQASSLYSVYKLCRMSSHWFDNHLFDNHWVCQCIMYKVTREQWSAAIFTAILDFAIL